MAAFNMGTYYMFAALTNDRAFHARTVVFRVVAFAVFGGGAFVGRLPTAFYGVAAWEILGSALTGVALVLEEDETRAGHPKRC